MQVTKQVGDYCRMLFVFVHVLYFYALYLYMLCCAVLCCSLYILFLCACFMKLAVVLADIAMVVVLCMNKYV
jgi:hypothetical protein